MTKVTFGSALLSWRVWVLLVLSSLLTTNYKSIKLYIQTNLTGRPNLSSEFLQTNLSTTTTDYINKKLHEHSSEFSPPRVIEVVSGVHVAIGYGLANIILIEGNSGSILIDSMESNTTALAAKKALQSIIDRSPIHSIIFTHFHTDHTQGTAVFFEDDKPIPTVYGHEKFITEYLKFLSKASSAINWRSIRQFATELQSVVNDTSIKNAFINNGIGPFIDHLPTSKKSLLFPTKTLSGEKNELLIDGIKMIIYHAPGETNDQIFIHIINKNILLPADNIYKAFPNLYAIRGSTPRAVEGWIDSLDKMRYLDPFPEYMIPSHTLPVYGKESIYNLLTVYRDGIAYLHDQTVRYMNRGYYIDDIIPIVTNLMPKRLKEHPYLVEYYGTIEWSIRAIFNNYLGWFSGDPKDLFPLNSKQRGNYILEMTNYIINNNNKNINNNMNVLINYLKQIVNKIESGNRSIIKQDCQFVLELSSWLLETLRKDNVGGVDRQLSGEEYLESDELTNTIKNIKISAMKCMAHFTISANGRNYYMSSIYEYMSGKRMNYNNLRNLAVSTVSIEVLMKYLTRMRFVYEDHIGENTTNSIIVYDINTMFSIEIRDGIAEIHITSYNKNLDLSNLDKINNIKQNNKNKKLIKLINDSSLVLYVTSNVWKQVACANKFEKIKIFATGKVKRIKGSILESNKFEFLIGLRS